MHDAVGAAQLRLGYDPRQQGAVGRVERRRGDAQRGGERIDRPGLAQDQREAGGRQQHRTGQGGGDEDPARTVPVGERTAEREQGRPRDGEAGEASTQGRRVAGALQHGPRQPDGEQPVGQQCQQSAPGQDAEPVGKFSTEAPPRRGKRAARGVTLCPLRRVILVVAPGVA